jgi:Methyltransferase domain
MLDRLRKVALQGIAHLRTRTVQDEYLDWLRFANAGMLHPGNVYSMDLAIANLPTANPVLEIGTFCGLSANVMSYLLRKHGRPNPIITADRWIFEGAEEGGALAESHVTHDEYRDLVRSSFVRNVETFSKERKPFAIELFSDELFEAWRTGTTIDDIFGRPVTLGGGISFCFIDGNHTYEFARRDFENADAHLDTGGFLLFDDSADSDPFGLTRLMREIRALGRYELVLKNPNYLFRKTAG